MLGEVVRIGVEQVGAQRHLAGELQQLPVPLLVRGEGQEVPGGQPVLARGEHRDVLGVGEGDGLFRGDAVRAGHGHEPVVDLIPVGRDRPRPRELHRRGAHRHRVVGGLLLRGEPFLVQGPPELGDRETVGRVESRGAVLHQQSTAGLREVHRVEVEPRLVEVAGRCGPEGGGRGSRADDLAGALEEGVEGVHPGGVRVDAGGREDLPVEHDHHGVRLPGQLVVPARPVVLGIAAGQFAAALLDVLTPALEGGQVHQAAGADPIGQRGGGGVEDEVGRGAGDDRGGDRLFGAGAGGDLLQGHGLLRPLGVPGLGDGVSPGELLLVVGDPDADGSSGGGRLR